MANDSIRGRQVVLRLTNKSGGGLVEGDVVIISSGTAAAITTTTSAGQTADMIGVVLETIANDAIGRVCIMGYTPKINLSASASLGDTFATHSVAKQATPSASRSAGAFGEVLGTGTTPAALLWGFPDASAASGMAGDSLWDAAGDLAIGTGANTGGRLAIGTANQILRVNSGATAPEWASLGRVLLGEQTPTGTGTVTFNSIPGTYKSLWLEFVARTDKVAASSSPYLYFNNDTTAANYSRNTLTGTGGSASSGRADNSSVFTIAGASATAGECGQCTALIVNYYGSTFYKTALATYVVRTGATAQITSEQALEWENTAAITRIDIVTDDASNYVTGSTFRLYGVN